MKGKSKQMGDFVHCYCSVCIITKNEGEQKQKFVFTFFATS